MMGNTMLKSDRIFTKILTTESCDFWKKR